ncbi:uncharacterized protein LOC114520442 [Dendronephthya gigantea]|uniref:uncharacterized protein LOC114520442 n=1 Tax=Dendronephthya gigantea TaxID=151771 RepID=UPI00106AC636|nr:uncharacterized protein LOC114520442 [Dendronephthya gigantea]
MMITLKIPYLLVVAFFGLSSGASLSNEATFDQQPCTNEYLRIARDHPESRHMLPRCDDKGQYKPLQRTYSSFACYYPHGVLDNVYNYQEEGPCHKLKQCLKNHASEGNEDYKLIRCDPFGLFESLQKLEDERLICMLPEGEFPEPYGFTAGKSNCVALQPCRQTADEIADEESFPSHTLPRCNAQGRFKPLQVYNDKVECYYPSGADFADYYAARGPCRKVKRCLRQKYYETRDAKEHKLLRCDKFGYFKPLQMREDGKMICVDFQGNVRKRVGVTGTEDCLYSVIVH